MLKYQAVLIEQDHVVLKTTDIVNPATCLSAPSSEGWLTVGASALKVLPHQWSGACTLGGVVPNVTVIYHLDSQKGWLRSYLRCVKRETANLLVERSTGFQIIM